MLFDMANTNLIVQSIINRLSSFDNLLWFSCPIPNPTSDKTDILIDMTRMPQGTLDINFVKEKSLSTGIG